VEGGIAYRAAGVKKTVRFFVYHFECVYRLYDLLVLIVTECECQTFFLTCLIIFPHAFQN